MLHRGDYGVDVGQLQQYLTNLKNPKFDPDGVDKDFGPATQKAVKAFQKAQKIEIDGVVGPVTVARLKAALGVAG
jgi:peptidoglycan hydrolase-like protein with peptidoglycan-binding domain